MRKYAVALDPRESYFAPAAQIAAELLSRAGYKACPTGDSVLLNRPLEERARKTLLRNGFTLTEYACDEHSVFI